MHYHKYKDHIIEGFKGPKLGLAGEIQCILRDEMGRVVYDSGPSPNLITNFGLDAYHGESPLGSNRSIWATCYIGSGTNTPAFTDTQMQTGLGAAQGLTGLQYGSFYEYYDWGASPKWMASQNFSRFNAGVGTGTINEVGFSPYNYWENNTGSPYLTIRHLTPAPIVKGASNILDVWYKFFWYFDETDATGTIVLDGQTYNYTCRWIGLTGSNQGYTYNYTLSTPGIKYFSNATYSDGELAATTATALTDGQVSGNGISLANLTPVYPNQYRDMRMTVNVDWELTSKTIRSFRCQNMNGQTGWQARFGRAGGGDEAIPKTTYDILWIDGRIAWDRYTP